MYANISEFGVVAPMIEHISPKIMANLSGVEIAEGNALGRSVTITDPDSGSWRVSIDYGDGRGVFSRVVP